MGTVLSNAQADAIMQAADTDGDGQIDKEEFDTMMRAAPLPPFLRKGGTVAELVAAAIAEGESTMFFFRDLDADGSGALSRDELMEGMAKRGQALSDAQADAIMAAADTDGDGQIDEKECVASMRMFL
jgi:calmodulin